MKRPGTISRHHPIARGSGPRPSGLTRARKAIKASNAARKAASFIRCYGSVERVEWIKAQPCVVCCMGPCENAHVTGGGGSRKADARFIVPLCGPDYIGRPGHHRELHLTGVVTFSAKYAVDLLACAEATNAAWLAHVGAAAA